MFLLYPGDIDFNKLIHFYFIHQLTLLITAIDEHVLYFHSIHKVALLI